MVLIVVTMMLIIVTTIPTIATIVSVIISFTFRKFSIVSPPKILGSSQNVLILAKGEPLTVLVTPTFIIWNRKG